MFRVGQKVVCIDDTHDKKSKYTSWGLVYPIKDKVYTVRGFHPLGGSIYLNEINNSHLSSRTSSGYESGFKIIRFKPLELDYNFVEEVIKQVEPIKEEA